MVCKAFLPLKLLNGLTVESLRNPQLFILPPFWPIETKLCYQNLINKLKFKNMSRFFKTQLFFFLIISVSACDCFTNKSGYVLDFQTNEPIVNAKVSLDNYSTITDSLGKFELHFITGRCPKWNLKVSKETYLPFELKINMKRNYIEYKVSNSYKKDTWEYLNSTCFYAISQDSIIVKLRR